MASRNRKNAANNLVYSTDKTRTCAGCLRPLASCVCKGNAARQLPIGGDGVVRLHRETKGRKGAGVTLVKGLKLDDAGLKTLAKRLKSTCGVGGSVKDGVIELQGDHREMIKSILEKDGHSVKIAGG